MRHRHLQIRGEPAWRRDVAARALVPREIQPWIYDPGSLTRRLQRACGAGFRVRLLRQAWGRPEHSEARLLGLGGRELAQVREVHLLCGDQVVVFAHSVIPASLLTGPQRGLMRLGSRPLGALLFQGGGAARLRVEVARLRPGDKLYGHALRETPAADELWGRRTLFRLGGGSLLVNEFFFPWVTDLEQWV